MPPGITREDVTDLCFMAVGAQFNHSEQQMICFADDDPWISCSFGPNALAALDKLVSFGDGAMRFPDKEACNLRVLGVALENRGGVDFLSRAQQEPFRFKLDRNRLAGLLRVEAGMILFALNVNKQDDGFWDPHFATTFEDDPFVSRAN